MKVTYIDQFLFDRADYVVKDTDGSEIMLHMDYRNNTFMLEYLDAITNVSFLHEVEAIAEDLLFRKHGKNFAERS